MSEFENTVVSLLSRRREDGHVVFSDDEVREAIPLLCIGLKRALPDFVLPDVALECIGEIAAKANVVEGTPTDQVSAKIAAYYSANTSPLIKELEILMRSIVGLGAADEARALAKVIGASTKLKASLPGERPKGTVAAGPAARFVIRDTFPPRK